MKVIVDVSLKQDVPGRIFSIEKFKKNMEQRTRDRLSLGSDDVVEVWVKP